VNAANLPDVLDAQRDDERRRCIRALLRHPLLTPAGPDPQAFALARRHAAWLGDWFASQAGWTVHSDHAVVRLRKVPGELSDTSRGAAAKIPFGRRRYVLACLALAALERAEAQVTLGWLVDRIVAFAADPSLTDAGITFTLDNQEERRDLVAVSRLLLGAGVLARVAGDEQAFIVSTGDALYDVNRQVLASLLVTMRGASTLAETGFEERLAALVAEPRPETGEARNREIRHRLVRRLLDDPVLYYADLSGEEREYLSSQRGPLLRRLTDATGFAAEVRAEGIALLDPTGEATDLGMPEEGTDGHATLLLAEYLAGTLRERPGTQVPLAELYRHVAALAQQHKAHWRKGTADPGAERELADGALRRLTALGLVRHAGDAVAPLPALARYGYAEPVITAAAGGDGDSRRSPMAAPTPKAGQQ
jgi:uncharacterized protein (TIGR02678 family)